MSHSITLPVEVLGCIIRHLRETLPTTPRDESNSADQPFLEHESVVYLLKLRLLSKAWADAIPVFIYRSLFLRTPWINRYMMKMSEMSMGFSYFSSLRRLSLRQLVFLPLEDHKNKIWDLSDECNHQHDYEDFGHESSLILMHDASDIITLCGRNLEELRLNFTRSVGFSSALLVAMKQIRNLKTLIIEGPRVTCIRNDHDSLISVLNNTASLESLSLRICALESLDLNAGSLPNLGHLWISPHPYNVFAVNKFCSSPNRPIRFLEYAPSFQIEHWVEVVLKLQHSLECFSVNVLPSHNLRELRLHTLPKLKLIRSKYINPSNTSPNWLHWPLMQAVKVLVTDFHEGRLNWRYALKQIAKFAFNKGSNLKHIVFVTSKGGPFSDEELENFFGRRHIQCHFRTRINHIDILNLVDELNSETIEEVN